MQGRSPIHILLAIVVLCCTLSVERATAGQIDPGLESRMQSAGANELIQVVIRPVGTLQGSALKKQVTAQHATRAEQHTATVQALQATANITQPAILSAISST